MIIGIPKEGAKGERRVAATPQSTKRLIKLGYDVLIESGAGEQANFPDDLYAAAGAKIVDDHAGTMGSHHQRNVAADASTRTRDKCNFSA